MTRVLLAPFVPHFHARRKDIHRGVWRDVTDVQGPTRALTLARTPAPARVSACHTPCTARTHPVHARWPHRGGGNHG